MQKLAGTEGLEAADAIRQATLEQGRQGRGTTALADLRMTRMDNTVAGAAAAQAGLGQTEARLEMVELGRHLA